MKKLLFLLVFIPLVFACSSDPKLVVPEPSFTITIYNPLERGNLQQLTAPGYVFELDGNQDYNTVILDEGMPAGLNDVRVTLTYICSIGGGTINKDIYINFIEDMGVRLTFNSFVGCGANISITYY